MAAKSTKSAAPAPAPESDQYLVVARRYRPQSFPDLVGQAHVSSALSNAIQQNRVGHAYLFSGARGTGKTSSARIFAKCLNCQQGPSVTPCQVCDSCQGITSGDDLDVLEIDGASNRRIEEIRQLRSNVNVRPSRSRFKIYIIDEVHMLTKEAFNALLKTLEEPPDHVKFIFCTTELDKIPITIRSRCQLFEFMPVEERAIRQRLKQIALAEKVAVDDDALILLSRRAAGSMRDSQSLLEQLLSLGQTRISLADVNRFLGTADSMIVRQMVEQLMAHNAAGALTTAQQAFRQGVDAGQLTTQLLGFFRDCLAASVGCDDELLLHASPDQFSYVRQLGTEMGLEQALAIAQILDDGLVKMRTSTHPQVLLELSLVRICRLEELQALSDLIEQLRQTASPNSVATRQGVSAGNVPVSSPRSAAPAEPSAAASLPSQAAPSKKNEPIDVSPAYQPAAARPELVAHVPTRSLISGSDLNNAAQTPPTAAPMTVTSANVESIWKRAIGLLGDTTADMAGQHQRLEWHPDGRIVVTLSEQFQRYCNLPQRKSSVENMLAQVVGQPIRVEFVAAATAEPLQIPPAPISRLKLMRDSARDPLVRAAIDLFDATVTDASGSKTALGDARPASGPHEAT